MIARPLTYLSSDGSDLAPLTPSIFLQDVREVGVPDCDYLDATSLKNEVEVSAKRTPESEEAFSSGICWDACALCEAKELLPRSEGG